MPAPMPTLRSLRWPTWLLALGLMADCAGSTPARSPERPPALPFSPGRAAPARKAKLDGVASALDALFAAKMKESGATGLAVGVIVDGELAYQRGFGVRDLASGAPVDVDTVFRIASMTKGFTALAVLKLRDEGRVELDVPAETYLPALGALAPPTRDAPPISLRLLLTNAAGLAYDDLWGTVTFGKIDDDLADLLRRGVQLPTTPGTRYAYSNLGWALLGKVVERVSGRSYRTYVTEDLLRPLGMTSSVWEPGDVPPGRLAIGYRRGADGQYVEEPRPSDGVFAAGGGLYMSLRDYARFAAFQLEAYPPRDDPEAGPVRRSTLREMHTGQRWARSDKDPAVARNSDEGLVLGAASYGFGWLSVTSCTDDPGVQHGGFEPGYFGWVVLNPLARVGFIALSTSGPAGIASRFAVFSILRDAGLLEAPAVRPHRSLEEAAAAMPSLLERWSPALFERTFDPDSARYSWNEGLRERFERLGREHGRCRPAGPLHLYGPLHGDLRLACERGAIELDLLLSPATPPRLQEVGIKEELLPDGVAKAGAKAIAAAIGAPDNRSSGSGNDGLDVLPLAPAMDQVRTWRTLRRLGLSYSACVVERGWMEVTHGVWHVDRSLRCLLRCAGGPLEVAFATDSQTGRITSLDVHPPRAPDATCWP
jgi:CubicO group peptidase (beta-lactamase class C family)